MAKVSISATIIFIIIGILFWILHNKNLKKLIATNEVADRVRNITYLANVNNYVGYDMLSYSKDDCLKAHRFIAFWELNGMKGKLEFEQSEDIILGIQYVPSIEKLCIPTTKGIFLVNPITSRIERNLANKKHRFIGSSFFASSKLIVTGVPDATSRNNYILSELDLSTLSYKAVQFPFVNQLYATKDQEYYAVIDQNVYTIDQQLPVKLAILPQMENRSMTKIRGHWPNNGLIISYAIDEVETTHHIIKWNDVVINLECDSPNMFQRGKYLWVSVEDKLRLYNIEGGLCHEFHLREHPSAIGPQNDDRAWLFYSDSTVDLIDTNGNKTESIHLDI